MFLIHGIRLPGNSCWNTGYGLRYDSSKINVNFVGKIYESTDKFYNWSPVYLNFNTSIKELEINSKGEVYAAGWNEELYQTSDWGQSWNQLGKPIPGNQYNYELTITKDDYIWANKWSTVFIVRKITD